MKKTIATVKTNYYLDDAKYREWWTTFETELLAVSSVTRVAKTGEFDFTTGVRPGTSNVTDKWRCYALADNGGSLPDYYLKIGWGTQTAVGYPETQITVAKSLDANGVPVGNFATARFGVVGNGHAQASDFGALSYTCGDEASDVWWFARTTSTSSSIMGGSGNLWNNFFSICRTRDPLTGLKDGRGLIVVGGTGYYTGNGGNQYQMMVGPNAEAIYNYPKIMSPVPGGLHSNSSYNYNVSGANLPTANEDGVSLFPIVEPYGPNRITLNGVTYFLADFPKALTNLTLPILGSNRNVMLMGPFCTNGASDTFNLLSGNSYPFSMGMIWEGTDV